MKKMIAFVSAGALMLSGMCMAEGLKDVLPGDFIFTSGAGAWRTEMNISDQMTFSGMYSDSEMGDTGEGYEFGSCYVCIFDGNFSAETAVGDGSYSMTVETINYQNEPGEEEIEDQVRYVFDEAFGIAQGDAFIYYPEGFLTENVDENALEWIRLLYGWGETDEAEIPTGVLFNATQGYAFMLESFED